MGPGPVEAHLDHSRGFVEVVGGPISGRAVDLGSGAGVPGLVLALADQSSEWTLLDARERSAEFLRVAVSTLGLADRVQVVGERAEVIARSELRGTAGLVVARGVGPPAATAEYAAGFLAVGGWLVVSEPPESDGSRWDPAGLDALGMGPAEVVETSGGTSFARIAQVRPAPDGTPRRTGLPTKRPLF